MRPRAKTLEKMLSIIELTLKRRSIYGIKTRNPPPPRMSKCSGDNEDQLNDIFGSFSWNCNLRFDFVISYRMFTSIMSYTRRRSCEICRGYIGLCFSFTHNQPNMVGRVNEREYIKCNRIRKKK